MDKKRVVPPPPRRSARRRVLVGALAMIPVGGVAFWWLSDTLDLSGGTPRLVLDREVVDLGYLPFEAPARVVFTLTNAGNGSLRLAGVPRVKVLKGC